MPRKPRGEMTPEEIAYVRKLNKKHRVARDRGLPCRVHQHELDEAMARVRRFHAKGVSTYDMCRETGIHETTFAALVRGFRTGPNGREPVRSILRTTYDKIMAMPDREVSAEHGSFVDACGARRRLQALIMAGYSYNMLAKLWGGNGGNSPVWKLARGMYGSDRVHVHTADKVARIYDKLIGGSPLDLGGNDKQMARAKRSGAIHGFAPATCWDEDTIDDPNAFPEWTGLCGTPFGEQAHRRYEIWPICSPCRTARNEYRRELREKKDGR